MPEATCHVVPPTEVAKGDAAVTRKRRPRKAAAGPPAEVAIDQVDVDSLDDSNGSSAAGPSGELVEAATEVAEEEQAIVASIVDDTVVEVAEAEEPAAGTIPAQAVEQLLVDEVAPEEAPELAVEDVLEPVLVEAEDLTLSAEPLASEPEEEPWLELEEVPLPPRGEAAEEVAPAVEAAPALAAEAAQWTPPKAGAATPWVSPPAKERAQPRRFFGWLVGAVIVGAAIGAIAALLVLSGINGGLSYVTSVSGVTLLREQSRLASEIVALTQDMADVQAELASLDELASRVEIMGADVTTLSTGLTTVNRGLDEISVGLGSLSTDLTSLGGDVSGISDEVTELAKGAEALRATASALEADVGALDGRVIEIGEGLGGLASDLDVVGEKVEELGTARAKFDSFLDGLRALLSEAAPSE